MNTSHSLAAGRMLKVLHVQKATGIGGSEQHLAALLGRLDRARFAPFMLVLEDPARPCPDFLALLERQGIPHGVMLIRRDVDPRLVWRLARYFRRERPDIVHTHLIHADLLAIPAARLARVPAVVSTKHGANPFRRGVVGRLDGAVSHLARRVIVISDYLRTFYRDVEGIPEERITRIHYGLEPSPLPGDGISVRAELGVPPDALVVGVVARLQEGKGHADLLAAFPKVRAQIPQARLLLVGEGPLRPPLEAQAARLGLEGAVTFTGFRADVDRLLTALDLFVLPSLSEGFGLAILEAMRAARPVVATAVAAIPEIVVPDETGLLVPPADADALAAAMITLLRAPGRRTAMGRAGRARALSEFGVEKMVEATAAVYARVAPAHAPAQARGDRA